MLNLFKIIVNKWEYNMLDDQSSTVNLLLYLYTHIFDMSGKNHLLLKSVIAHPRCVCVCVSETDVTHLHYTGLTVT